MIETTVLCPELGVRVDDVNPATKYLKATLHRHIGDWRVGDIVAGDKVWA